MKECDFAATIVRDAAKHLATTVAMVLNYQITLAPDEAKLRQNFTTIWP